jgi:hypothetical protein
MCALVAACVLLLTRRYAEGIRGIAREKKQDASEIRQWYQNERNSYSGISLNKECAHGHATPIAIHRKRVTMSWSRCKEKSNEGICEEA